MTEAAIRVREAQEKVDDVTKHLGLSQEEGGTTADDLTQANLDLADANRNNEEATGKVTDATDAQFDANVKAQQSALALAAAAYATAVANGDAAGAAGAATKSVESSREAFIKASVAAGMEAGAAADLATKLFGIPGKVATDLIANDQATAKIAAVQSSLAAIQSYKQITIETVLRESRVAVENGGVFDQPMAAGGVPVISGRGTSQMRWGSGDGVRWGEAQTGREYYLSMKSGMQQRNRMLAGAAVSELGGQAMWGRAGAAQQVMSGRAGDVRAGTFNPSSGGVNVAAPVVEVRNYIDGQQIDARTEVIVNGKLERHISTLERRVGQSR